MREANPGVDNNCILWNPYYNLNQNPRLAMESNAKELDIAMLVLHNSLNPEAIKDYAKSYLQGNTDAYPQTAELVARNVVQNYRNNTVIRSNKRSKKKPTNQLNDKGRSETVPSHVQGDDNCNQETS